MPRWPEMARDGTEMTRDGPRWPEMTRDDPRLSATRCGCEDALLDRSEELSLQVEAALEDDVAAVEAELQTAAQKGIPSLFKRR